MTQEQIDFLNTKLANTISIIDSSELEGINFSIKIFNGIAYLYIESLSEVGYPWNHIELRTQIKSLDHIDRLILSIKNLIKELE